MNKNPLQQQFNNDPITNSQNMIALIIGIAFILLAIVGFIKTVQEIINLFK